MITWKPEKKKVEDAKENLVFFEQIIDVDERTNKVEGSKKDTEDDMSQGGHTYWEAHVVYVNLQIFYVNYLLESLLARW